MAFAEVLMGVPARAATTEQLIVALGRAAEIDEQPTRMVCHLRRGEALTWLSFESTSIGSGKGLAEGFFTDVLSATLSELLVVARPAGCSPTSVHYWKEGSRQWSLLLADGQSFAVTGELPAGAETDGNLIQIGLRALGLELHDPFDLMGAPTGCVWLRVDRRIPQPLAIEKPTGPLPVGVVPTATYLAPDAPRTPCRPIGGVDDGQAFALVEQMWRWAAGRDGQLFAREVDGKVRELAGLGAAVVLPLAAKMSEPKPRPQALLLADATLGLVGGARAAELVAPQLAKASKQVLPAAFHALAAIGAPAREVLEEAAKSKRKLPREPAKNLLRLLDDPKLERLRTVRAARAALDAGITEDLQRADDARFGHPGYESALARRNELLAEQGAPVLAVVINESIAIRYAFERESACEAAKEDPLAPFALALVCVENPLISRKELITVGRKVFGSGFRRVAPIMKLLP